MTTSKNSFTNDCCCKNRYTVLFFPLEQALSENYSHQASSDPILDIISNNAPINKWIIYIIVIVLGIFIVMGVIGNILSVIVLMNRHMHMSNGIHCFLLALTVSDLMVLLFFIPQFLRYRSVLLGETISYQLLTSLLITYPFINFCKHSATWIIVSLSVIRFIAVSLPLKAKLFFTVKRSRITIIIIFVAVASYNFPKFFEYSLCNMNKNTTIRILTRTNYNNSKPSYLTYRWLGTIFFFLIPFSIIAALNGLLIKHLRGLSKLRHNLHLVSPLDEKKKDNIDNQLSSLLIAITIGFFILEFPVSVCSIIFDHFSTDNNPLSLSNLLIIIAANVLSASHSCINFMAFCVISQQYKKVFCERFSCQRFKTSSTETSSATTELKNSQQKFK